MGSAVKFLCWLAAWICWSLICDASSGGADTYDEELVFKRLKNEQLLSQFRFVVTSDVDLGPDYDLFPRIIAEVSNKYDVQEFHFSLAQGFWRAAEWGLPPQPSSPSGAQLYAWFNGNESSVDDRWSHFVNSLNGIFCASLLEMLPVLTASPRHSFGLSGLPATADNSFLRYGALAGETVCTENLTPWRKLLPCKETGLSTLLNPERLYSSYFHAMSIHFTRVCQDSAVPCVQRSRLELNLNLVIDYDLSSRSLDWSIYGIFGRKVDEKCPVARSSRVIFERDRPSVSIEAPIEKKNLNGRYCYVYDVGSLPADSLPFNLHGRYRAKLDLSQQTPESLFSVHSFLGGTDQQTGRLTTVIVSRQLMSQQAKYLHVIPWFMQIYFHSIALRCLPLVDQKGATLSASSAKLLNFVSAKNRQRPFVLEYELTLPASSICEFSFDFDKAFLRVTDFPPDASHGMYVPSAVITFMANEELWNKNRTVFGDHGSTFYEELAGSTVSHAVSLFGEVLLVLLPVPDFSMPFNVICFVSTAIAMLFGPVHSLTTKILIPVSQEDKDLVPKSLLVLFVLKIKGFVIRIKEKFGRKSTGGRAKGDRRNSEEENGGEEKEGNSRQKKSEIGKSSSLEDDGDGVKVSETMGDSDISDDALRKRKVKSQPKDA